ncbi:unnamed protein product [Schistosoma margrebowiei]|uniref:Uncharacterized protein n=1 Tax=Schistosoma margrebowiei TaxID=48269 RepID=A0A183LUS1_9TREM|nr:unnamed protein product [Schistosoma margrebowiei]
MKTSASGVTARMQLDDLDFANDLALLSHTQQMQGKTTSVAADPAAVGLNIHKGKRSSDSTQHAPMESHLTENFLRM